MFTSFEAYLEYLDKNRCILWGEKNKNQRWMKMGWYSRQKEIDHLRQKVYNLENKLENK